MAGNESRRQQRLMKKRRKDKLRRNARAHTHLSGTASERKHILEARSYPIRECLIGPGWRERGLAHILLSRTQPDGRIVAGAYLVDTFCLGLKNTFARANLSEWTYEAELRDPIYEKQGLEPCAIDLAHTIIYGAIDYARQFGFYPQRDFELYRYVLEERDSLVLRDDVEFGKDGKPLYISGPDDNVRKITRQLENVAGEGNFDFMVGGP
ncbi:MAG: hypothetical protein GWP14_02910 [Actinobacteria bacterium]|nr:hypothetical protein [Actinomycetota bacterium]